MLMKKKKLVRGKNIINQKFIELKQMNVLYAVYVELNLQKKKQSLSKHTEVMHGDIINFPCDECGQLFPRKSKNCSQHFSQTCSLCERVFFSRSVLKDHLNVHSGFKPYQCNEHSIEFHTKKRLRDHMYRRHELSHKRKNKSNPCNECNKKFVKKYGSCL